MISIFINYICENEFQAGYINIGDKAYLLEPVHDHQPNKYGQHLHLIYERKNVMKKRSCGSSNDWKNAWKENLKYHAKKNIHKGE